MSDDFQAPVAASSTPCDSQRVRWWPAVIVLVGAGVAGGLLWTPGLVEPGRRNLATQVLAAIGVGAMLLWALLLSRMAWRTRGMALVATLLAACAVAATVRVEGLRGDLWLDLAWRWSAPRPTAALADTETDAVDLTQTTDYDFPQFLGPDRSAVVANADFSTDWDAQPPTVVWRQPIGQAWSSFVVVGQFALTQEQIEGRDCTTCYELTTGRRRWKSVDENTPTYNSVVAGDGPRATPTVVDGKVFAMSVSGRLRCLDGSRGELQWSADVLADHQAQPLMWGTSCSPLVVDDLVVVGVDRPLAEGEAARDGHSCLAAYRRDTGKEAWQARGDAADFSSPVLATLGGQRQILFLSKRFVAGYDPRDGRRLWKHDWKNPESNVCNPVPVDDAHLFVSSGYGWGAALLAVTRDADGRWQVSETWRNKQLKAKFTNVVVYQGQVYGLDDGILTCLDVATGERRWKKGRYGHGQVLLAGGTLIVQAETGEVVLVAADPSEMRELGRFAALEGKTWNNPALSRDLLLIRNDQEAVCLRLAPPTTP